MIMPRDFFASSSSHAEFVEDCQFVITEWSDSGRASEWLDSYLSVRSQTRRI